MPHRKRGTLLPFLEEILQRHQRPDAAHQELLVLLDRRSGDDDPFDAQTEELRLIHITLLVEFYGHLVDDLVGPLLPDQRLYLLGFVRAHEVLCEDALHRLEALLDHFLVLR